MTNAESAFNVVGMADDTAMAKRLAAKARSGRRSLRVWVREKLDTIELTIKQYGATLEDIAEEAGKAGVRNAWGGPPSRGSVFYALKMARAERQELIEPSRTRSPTDKPFEFRTLRRPPKKQG